MLSLFLNKAGWFKKKFYLLTVDFFKFQFRKEKVSFRNELDEIKNSKFYAVSGTRKWKKLHQKRRCFQLLKHSKFHKTLKILF